MAGDFLQMMGTLDMIVVVRGDVMVVVRGFNDRLFFERI
jgi:hypothetical protein